MKTTTKGFEFYVFIILSIFISCVGTRKNTSSSIPTVNLDTITVAPIIYERYQAEKTKKWDLLHTKLDVSFDWENAHLHGKAFLILKPYFYSTKILSLDAKGFDIHSIEMTSGIDTKHIPYSYENDLLTIEFEEEYSKNDTINILIEYTAKPNELETIGGKAITDNRGLYFINPKGETKNKPKQIWTQGETESNSCWFPTIDSPNERMTQEIYITVDTSYMSLSNGTLMYSSENGDGTRTDYWKQELGHAPYLTMMAIGEYAIVRDQWRDIEVNYYVEPEYEPYAKYIFGHTPEMLQYFSDVLSYEYPWDKYSQIIVRDYVSGAMENTSAVIFGEFVQKTDREMLDGDNEDIVAHELFHHWFGDLVTCESWANLPLNESFATYGEYIWKEHKHGREVADHHLQLDLNSYLRTSKRKQVDIIRFDYEDKDDMFDSHSYAKGGRVLHMLRKYVGDEAFFAALTKYLHDNQYTDVEIHDLRIAFEEVTGEDLNWFFNQWFFNSGHPNIEISYQYNDSLHEQTVMIAQIQDLNTTPLYRLPIEIDIYENGKATRYKVNIDSLEQSFKFKTTNKPDLVNVDAEKMLLCSKNDLKTKEEWLFQYENAPLYLDKEEAIKELAKFTTDTTCILTISKGLKHPFKEIRLQSIDLIKEIKNSTKLNVKELLIEMAKNDISSEVRATAIGWITELYIAPGKLEMKDTTKDSNIFSSLLLKTIDDPSFMVQGESLLALGLVDAEKAMDIAGKFDNITKEKLSLEVATIYSSHGSSKENDFYLAAYENGNKYERSQLLEIYASYLINQNDSIVNIGLKLFVEAAFKEYSWQKITAIYAISSLYYSYEQKENLKTEAISDLNTAIKSENTEEFELKIKELDVRIIQIKKQKEKITTMLSEIKEKETNEKILKIWDQITPSTN